MTGQAGCHLGVGDDIDAQVVVALFYQIPTFGLIV